VSLALNTQLCYWLQCVNWASTVKKSQLLIREERISSCMNVRPEWKQMLGIACTATGSQLSWDLWLDSHCDWASGVCIVPAEPDECVLGVTGYTAGNECQTARHAFYPAASAYIAQLCGPSVHASITHHMLVLFWNSWNTQCHVVTQGVSFPDASAYN